MAKQALTVEILYDGTWHDATAADEVLSVRNPLELVRGRADEVGGLTPLAADLTLLNPDGDWNPGNPLSPLYGVAGRNTPIRLGMGVPHPGAASSSLVASTSHVAPSVDSPTEDGILICAWSGPHPSGSYTAPGDMTESLDQTDSSQTMMVARRVITVAGATGTKTATFSASETWLAATVLIHGPSSITTGALGGSSSLTPDGNAGDWWVLVSSFGWADGDIAPALFPRDTDYGGWVLLADTGTVDSADANAPFNRMKIWGKRVKTTDAAHTIEIESDSSVSTISWLTRIPAAQIDTVWSLRGHGEIASWSPRRPIKGTPTTDIEIAGVLRRLTQGAQPVRSAQYRTIMSRVNPTPPYAYYPMEDGKLSTVISSALSRQPALAVVGGAGYGSAEFGSNDLVPGSRPLPTFTARQIAGLLPSTSVENVWTLEFDHNASGTITTGCAFLTRAQLIAGVATWWRISFTYVNPGPQTQLSIAEHTASGSSTLDSATILTSQTFDGEGHHTRLILAQDGADVDWLWYLDGVLVDSGTIAAKTLTRLYSVEGMPFSTSPAVTTFGHLALYDQVADGSYEAMLGYPGETAGRRFERVCAEAGITAVVVGDIDDTQPMGPQFPDTTGALLKEIESTDDGFVYDMREAVGVALRTGRSRYNQEAVLTLTYGTDGIGQPLTPVIDDQRTRNDVTVNRREGGSATSTRTTGPMNINPPDEDPEGVGHYPHQVDVNTMSDNSLPGAAIWHEHQGTINRTRWPFIEIDLDATPALDGAVSSLDPGDRLDLAGLPAEDSPDTLQLIFLGASERVENHRRKMTLNCMPEDAYHILELEHDLYVTIGSSATYRRAGAITDVQTGITFRVEEGPDWVFETGFDIMVGGERMTVTSIAAASGTYPARDQVWTVTRSVNGVVKAHPNNVRVELFHPAYIGW